MRTEKEIKDRIDIDMQYIDKCIGLNKQQEIIDADIEIKALRWVLDERIKWKQNTRT